MQFALRWAAIAELVAVAVSGYLETERRGMNPIGHFALVFVAALASAKPRAALGFGLRMLAMRPRWRRPMLGRDEV